jgi:hypothetical protein
VTRSHALDNAQYAVMPNGETLQGWTPEEKEELDDLVRHKLHSRRAKMKRSLKGFGQYVRRREFTVRIHNCTYLTNGIQQLLDYSLRYMLR